MNSMHNVASALVSRRRWLVSQTVGLCTIARRFPGEAREIGMGIRHSSTSRADRIAQQSVPLDPAPWEALAQRAVEAAHTAGARYADARLTRLVHHGYDAAAGDLDVDLELVGISVRAVVQDGWGFSASAVITPDEAVRLARDAVAQARENAIGVRTAIELGTIPIATGWWATPIRIDPFSISIEEKRDNIMYWQMCAGESGVNFLQGGIPSWIMIARQERVMASSEGAVFTQTCYESGGEIRVTLVGGGLSGSIVGNGALLRVPGIDIVGAGWERFLDAKIPEQFLSGQIRETLQQRAALPIKPSTIGKYTLVCDGSTMAALVARTLGTATQLDRALGYEANAGGTSFITDPLGMVGTASVTSPLVTLTANRSAPTELATVHWDEEGVVPEEFPLITDGILVDFQTTRAQAAWLAPYYAKHGRPVRSHGCAAAESAHAIPMQQMPNLTMAPSASAIGIETLVADIAHGIYVEGGIVSDMDSQARTGLLSSDAWGRMRQIKNGKLGAVLEGGAVLFDTQTLWHNIKALGGVATQGMIGVSQFDNPIDITTRYANQADLGKGQPIQLTSRSVRAVAATIVNQPLIDPARKA